MLGKLKLIDIRLMKRVNIFLLLIILFALHSCSAPNKQKPQKAIAYEYPPIIDSLQLRNVYDSSMWFMYRLHGDLPCHCTNGTSDSFITYGQTDLQLLEVEQHNDSIRFVYEFICNGERLPYVTDDGKQVVSGTMYSKKDRKLLRLNIHLGYLVYEALSNKSPFKLNEAKAEHYIRQNESKIHPKFRHLAQQHLIL
jgi:hypothetical protein